MGRRLVPPEDQPFSPQPPACLSEDGSREKWGAVDPDLLADIFDSLPVGLVCFDAMGAPAAINRLARQILDLPAAGFSRQALGARLQDLAAPSPRPGLDVLLEGTLPDICVGEARYTITVLPAAGARRRTAVWRFESVSGEPEARPEEAYPTLPATPVTASIGHELNNLLARVICLAEEIQDEANLQRIHQRAETLILTAEGGAHVVRRLMTHASAAPTPDCMASPRNQRTSPSGRPGQAG